MDDLLKLAKDLGENISKHARFSKLREVEESLKNNSELQELLENYEKAFHDIRKKEDDQQAVEPEDKRALADMQNRISSEALLMDLAQAQADYAELMNLIQVAIRDGIEKAAKDE